MDNDDLMPSRPANHHWHYAPWLSWLQRPTVKRTVQSEGREFEPHWGRVFTHACANLLFWDQQRGLIHLGGNNVHSQRFGLFVEDANTAKYNVFVPLFSHGLTIPASVELIASTRKVTRHM